MIILGTDNPITPDERKTLSRYRRDLWLLILLSGGIDLLISAAGIQFALPTFGGSIIIDEIIEYVISAIIARNKLRLKKRYKIAGFIPIPGITSISLQSTIELIRTYRKPLKVIARLETPKEDANV